MLMMIQKTIGIKMAEEGTWSEEIYRQKLENISKVIPDIGYQYTLSHPTILDYAKLKIKVLIDLVQSKSMKDLSYGLIHFDSPDEEELMLLFCLIEKDLSRKIKNISLLLIRNGDRDYTRDQLMVEGYLDGEKI